MRRALGAVAVAVLLAGLPGMSGLSGLGAGAAADPSVPSDPGPATTRPDVRLLPHAGVRDYWTAKRMRTAVPLDLDPAGNATTAPASTSGVQGRTSGRVGEGLRSTGKLFFSDGGTNYVCSASSVNTPEKDLVVTAGHCVNSGGTRVLLGGCRAGTYYSNFMFVPGYDHNARPYGTWVGTAAIAQGDWVSRCDEVAHDQAMIRVAPQGGLDLVDVVGGNGLAWNYPVREDGVRVVGWPAEAPYDGQSRQECTGSTTVLDQTGDAQISCPLTGGASGGPWFLRMASADTGFIFAVTSRRTTSGPPLLLATPFDATIEGLLAAARVAGRPAARPVVGPESGPGVGRPKRQRLRLVATSPSVGFGEAYQLVAETRRVRRMVLQVRTAPGAPWARVAKARVHQGVTVFTQTAAPGTWWYRVKVRKARKHSAPVAVSVSPCPMPLDRTPSVVGNTRCTSPVG
ncbi:hypothetical protein FBY23_3169 [Nocardioides sp. SLBN-35]|nr:hypothetical protein FBY23_3169 [Nocardioides sp. SLBN-35]